MQRMPPFQMSSDIRMGQNDSVRGEIEAGKFLLPQGTLIDRRRKLISRQLSKSAARSKDGTGTFKLPISIYRGKTGERAKRS
jgi:hypothetical protein